MHAELHIKDADTKIEKTECRDTNSNTCRRDVLDATEITIEEVSIDGICGVY